MRLILFILILLYLIAPNLPGQTKDTQKDQKINQRIKEINAKLQNIEKEKDSILDQIYKIELQYEKEVIQKNRLERKIIKIKEQIAVEEKKKKTHLNEIKNFKDDIKNVLRILYKTGGNTYLKLFLRLKDFDQLFKNYYLFISLVNLKSNEISLARQTITEIIAIEQRLNNQKAELKKMSDLKLTRIRSLSRIKNSKIDLLNEISNDKLKNIKHLNELKLQAKEIDSIITTQKNTFETKFIDTNTLKNKLIWPLKGKIITTFGKKRSKNFNTYTFNNGIEIRPEANDSIKSVLPGMVLYSSYLKGYGNVLIIQHSSSFYTLYGHCSKFLVSKGQAVRKGEFIALAGDSGSLRGKCLHFEIRININAKNPLNWLRKR